MPVKFFYTMVQKSQKWPKTQIKGGPALRLTSKMYTIKSSKAFKLRPNHWTCVPGRKKPSAGKILAAICNMSFPSHWRFHEAQVKCNNQNNGLQYFDHQRFQPTTMLAHLERVLCLLSFAAHPKKFRQGPGVTQATLTQARSSLWIGKHVTARECTQEKLWNTPET